MHVYGTPLAYKQSDLTEIQRVFLEQATIEHINEERDFQLRLMGYDPVKAGMKNSDVREEALKQIKRPH